MQQDGREQPVPRFDGVAFDITSAVVIAILEAEERVTGTVSAGTLQMARRFVAEKGAALLIEQARVASKRGAA